MTSFARVTTVALTAIAGLTRCAIDERSLSLPVSVASAGASGSLTKSYTAGGSAGGRSSQGAGSAGWSAQFYGTPACNGTASAAPIELNAATTDRWVPLEQQVVTPDTAESVLLKLVLAMPPPQTTLEARFDNILLMKH